MSAKLNPAWITDTVRQLAVRAYGKGQPTRWSGANHEPNPDHVPAEYGVLPILADALQDAGCDNEPLLADMRADLSAWRWAGYSDRAVALKQLAETPVADLTQWYEEDRVWRLKCRIREAATAAIALANKTHADYVERIVRAEHAARIARKLASLENRSKIAYATREVSRGYWLAQYAAMLRTPGYVAVEKHDLRGTPPAGTIWVRPASSGRWGKSRRDKWGRPMTPAEVEAYVAAQAAKETARVAN